jgi:hypothetical protein
MLEILFNKYFLLNYIWIDNWLYFYRQNLKQRFKVLKFIYRSIWKRKTKVIFCRFRMCQNFFVELRRSITYVNHKLSNADTVECQTRINSFRTCTEHIFCQTLLQIKCCSKFKKLNIFYLKESTLKNKQFP